MTWRVPQPDMLGVNGTFGAFRVLRQDVGRVRGVPRGDRQPPPTAPPTRWRRRSVAAGATACPSSWLPTQRSRPSEHGPRADDLRTLDAFGYRRADRDGTRCPIGSHIRRSNPRDSHIVQRGTNDHRLVVRRGACPTGRRTTPTTRRDKDVRRGLLGNFLCASLPAQFEACSATGSTWASRTRASPAPTTRWSATTTAGLTSSGGRRATGQADGDPPAPVVRAHPGRRLPLHPQHPGLRWIGAAGWK